MPRPLGLIYMSGGLLTVNVPLVGDGGFNAVSYRRWSRPHQCPCHARQVACQHLKSLVYRMVHVQRTSVFTVGSDLPTNPGSTIPS
jgi:hypothetical protein